MTGKKHLQWQKDYSFDELYDYQRDILESFDKRFNPDAVEPKTDHNGVFDGVYRITIEYIEKGPLDDEIWFYNQHKKEYLEKYNKRFVLIKNEELHGDFDSAKQAYEFGVKKFGSVPMLIKEVLEVEPVVYL